MRRAEPPLLVLVRTESRMELDLLAPGRDPGVPARRRGAPRCAAVHPVPMRPPEGGVGRATPGLAARDVARPAVGASADRRPGPPQRAFDPATRRARALQGGAVSLGDVEARARP